MAYDIEINRVNSNLYSLKGENNDFGSLIRTCYQPWQPDTWTASMIRDQDDGHYLIWYGAGDTADTTVSDLKLNISNNAGKLVSKVYEYSNLENNK